MKSPFFPADELVSHFAADFDALIAADTRIGVAVSGGPDSLALLLLANAARPGRIEAATVDHGLRAGSADEATMVAKLCGELGVPHRTLLADWPEPPVANVQAAARAMRYRLLNEWAIEQGLAGVATAHHADDQAETLLMRLLRGSGVGGLGGSRKARALSEEALLIRPLLGWRKSALEAIARGAGLSPVDDPSNRDPRHDRSRIRQLLEFDRLDRSGAASREFVGNPRCRRGNRLGARAADRVANPARWRLADHRTGRPTPRVQAPAAARRFCRACRPAPSRT